MLRREFTQLVAGLPLMLSLPLNARAGALAWHETADGVLALVDPQQTDYRGAGYYLYPSWGKPQRYYVESHAGRLNFLAADSRQLLWQQPAMPGMFAASVIHTVPAAQSQDVRQTYASVQVPVLPVG